MCSLELRNEARDVVIDVMLCICTVYEFVHFVYEWVCTVGNFIHH